MVPETNDRITIEGTSLKTWNHILVAVYILSILEESPMYGNQLRTKIKDMSNGLYLPNPNALYPVLRILEEEGHITSNMEVGENRKKRFYYVTEKGKALYPKIKERTKIQCDYLRGFVDVLHKTFGV